MPATERVEPMPAACRNHGDAPLVRTTVTKGNNNRMTEFFCAVGQCGAPLGWCYQYQQDGSQWMRNGPGACQDAWVHAHRLQKEYDRGTEMRVDAAIITLVAAGVIACASWNEAPVAAAVIAALVATGVPALLLSALRRKRQRPDHFNEEPNATT